VNNKPIYPTARENEDVDIVRSILEELLSIDQDITAREVARRHPSLKAASSITRDPVRRALLSEYQHKQKDLRQWAARTQKTSAASVERILTDRDARISQLERQVEVLVASHVAMLRAVGEIGGFGQWARFFEKTSSVRAMLDEMGALPASEIVRLPKRG